MMIRTFAAVTFALLIAGCQSNPISVAKSTEQKAFASYGMFVVWEEQAAKLLCQPTPEAVCPGNPDIPDNVKSGIKLADARAKPVADDLYQATVEFSKMVEQVAAGESPAAMLDVATANLLTWIARARPLIQGLVDSIQGRIPDTAPQEQ